ncbi:MAG TPA: glycosyltransferase family 2 protein, partial [Thermomicrobiales bacterium]|nr:glycosyltransferase family 2 protein [Thermomicrobiales bacterium]
MNTATRVSAIITTYNYGEFIVEAIESVLNQTRPPDEVFVVDDGSTDQTSELVAPYVERGQVVYIQQANSGPSEARNNGFERSTGDLIAFLDADDTWLPDKLERQLAWLAAHPRASMVSGPMIWWHVPRDERWVVAFKAMPAARFRREVTIRNLVGNPSMALIRRTALERAGLFDTTLRWGQDWEIFVRLARVGEVGFVADPVIVYRWHRGNLSHERRMEQLSMNHSISRRAIATHLPGWQRPILRLRSWSVIEFDRARIHHTEGGPRVRTFRHAALALLSWPLEDTREKAKLLGRSLVGEATYQ